MTRAVESVQITGKASPALATILTDEAAAFLCSLHRAFNFRRKELLSARRERQAAINRGTYPNFLQNTEHIRKGQWQVASAPLDLQDRRVEITGPVEPKMMINALNSGANVFMADFEDSLSPTFTNVINGQIHLTEAVSRQLTFTSTEGKNYRLNEKLATLVVRPRGWHLSERHMLIDDEPISASLFDFGLYFFHNAPKLIQSGSGPYFYLPKMESHLEARLWNDVFNFAQDALEIPRGTIRATVLIETILAAFEMEEILYELREHASGLNAGRWDYIFSIIKKFASDKEFLLPDRSQITMTVPFMQAYCQLLVQTCHRRGAHAMGGMAAFIPSRKDAAINEQAFQKVRADKQREASIGFDGTWVAHPDLVPVAREAFDLVLGNQPHQKTAILPEQSINASDLLNVKIDNGLISEAGLRNNIGVALEYIESWLRGLGAVALNNLMEDAATAEISRSQLWQWLHNQAKLDDGRTVDKQLYETIRRSLLSQLNESGQTSAKFIQAAEILDSLIDSQEFVEFLTIPAYAYLDD